MILFYPHLIQLNLMDNNNDVTEPNRQEIPVNPEVESIKPINKYNYHLRHIYSHDKFILIQFRSI